MSDHEALSKLLLFILCAYPLCWIFMQTIFHAVVLWESRNDK